MSAISPVSDSDGFLIQVPSQHGLLIFPPNSSFAGDVTMAGFLPLVPSHPVPAVLLLPLPNYPEPFSFSFFLKFIKESQPLELGDEKRQGFRPKSKVRLTGT